MSEAIAPTPIKSPKGFSRFLWGLLSAIFWGWCLSICIYSVMWYQVGFTSMTQALRSDLAMQRSVSRYADLRSAPIAGKVGDIITTGLNRCKAFFAKMGKPFAKFKLSSLPKSAKQSLLTVSRFIKRSYSLLTGSGKLVIAKFFSVFISLPVMVFAALLGAADGLLKRYIRTQEGGRESTFVYHRVSDRVIALPVWILWGYLISPFDINPQVVVVLMSILLFCFFNISTANLKKFI